MGKGTNRIGAHPMSRELKGLPARDNQAYIYRKCRRRRTWDGESCFLIIPGFSSASVARMEPLRSHDRSLLNAVLVLYNFSSFIKTFIFIFICFFNSLG